jgi:hypothetical protein
MFMRQFVLFSLVALFGLGGLSDLGTQVGLVDRLGEATAQAGTPSSRATGMAEGMRLLNLSIRAQSIGDMARVIVLLDQAVAAAPRLGLAYVTRAQYFMMKGQFAAADKDFTIGLPLLFSSDQPKMTIEVPGGGATTVSPSELAGDELISHGYCLIRMAEHIADYDAQKKMLMRAKVQLNAGLKQKPSPERRQMGTDLLKSFQF